MTRKPAGDEAAIQNRAGKSFGAYALCIKERKRKFIFFGFLATSTNPDVLALYLVKKGYSDRHENNKQRISFVPVLFWHKVLKCLKWFRPGSPQSSPKSFESGLPSFNDKLKRGV